MLIPQMRKVRLKRLNNLSNVTQLLNGIFSHNFYIQFYNCTLIEGYVFHYIYNFKTRLRLNSFIYHNEFQKGKINRNNFKLLY